MKSKSHICTHKDAHFFHENAPMYCPYCNYYLTPDFMKTDPYFLTQDRNQKIKKILKSGK